MSADSSRSAIVRASLMMRVQARADSPIFSMILSRMLLHAGLRGQYFSICLLFIAALQNRPSSSLNLSLCVSLAFKTLAATVALDSAAARSTSLRGSTGDIQICISIRSIIGPDSFDRYAMRRDGVQVHLSPSP